MNFIAEMNPLEILGAGAIGLGFLLACLTYSLLRKEREDYNPIYFFQGFCLVLMLIGAWMQYLSLVDRQKLNSIQTQLNRLDDVHEDVRNWTSLPSADRQPVMEAITGIQADILAIIEE